MENNDVNSQTPMICSVVGRQSIGLSVPVSVHPFANIGKITTKCCDEAIVIANDTEEETSIKECNFTIKQKICIEVPVEFGAKVDTGETFISCGLPSNETEEDCDEDDENEDDDEDEQDEDQKRSRFFGNN